jgi:hypothetical protein
MYNHYNYNDLVIIIHFLHFSKLPKKLMIEKLIIVCVQNITYI